MSLQMILNKKFESEILSPVYGWGGLARLEVDRYGCPQMTVLKTNDRNISYVNDPFDTI